MVALACASARQPSCRRPITRHAALAVNTAPTIQCPATTLMKKPRRARGKNDREDSLGPIELKTIQAQILAPRVDEDVVAYGRLVQRDGDAFWADVDVVGQSSAQVVGRGTVLYRIVT